MKTNTFLVLSFYFLFSQICLAQHHSIDANLYVNSTKFISEFQKSIKPEQFFVEVHDLFKLSSETQLSLVKENIDGHYVDLKYQQYYAKLPVFGALYNLHTKDGIVYSSNGTLYPNVQPSNKPGLNSENAINAIVNYEKVKLNKDNKNNKIINIPDWKILNNELCYIDPLFPKYSGQLLLAYNIITELLYPLSKKEYFVDATTGSIIYTQNLICSLDVPSKAKTKYYGTQNIITDSIAQSLFTLHDNSRNITTYVDRGSRIDEIQNYSSNWDLTSPDLNEVALDAHYCASSFHDMMLQKFKYNGIDGKGGAIRPVVHAGNGADLVNAYWTGEFAYFGNGSCHYSPLTTLTIVAHEFTHGVTQYNSNLVYGEEPGALNEALSDIFGKACEYFYDRPNFDWQLDNHIKGTKYANLFRSFSDPNSLRLPKTYHGRFWDPNQEVHTNSNVLNHWFYLLIEGGQGTSELNKMYKVDPVDMQDVLDIVFTAQQSYLTPTSGYRDMYRITKEIAKNKFGLNSKTYNSILQAWLAVGIDDSLQSGKVTDLSLTSTDLPVNFCDGMGDKIANIEILNSGTETILAGEEFELSIGDDIFITSQFIPIKLEKNLNPGEKLIIQTEPLDLMDGPGSYTLEATIDYVDDNPDNNSSYNPLFLATNEANDLEVTYLYSSLLTCSKPQLETYLYVTNISCDKINKGTKIQIISDVDGNIVKNKSFALPNDLLSGDQIQIVDTVLVSTLSGILTQHIDYADDSNDSNNDGDSDFEYPSIAKAININFSNDTWRDYLDNYNFSFADPILKIGTNNVFATSGIPYLDVDPPCLENTRNLRSDYISNLSTCLDLSSMKQSKLSFDINQYRADSLKYPELWDKSSSVEINWIENGIKQSKIIASQEEGKWVSHEVVLPNKYQGELNFNFYNHFGPLEFDITDKILKYDAVLLDNFKISELTSANNSVLVEGIDISPNPGDDLIFISSNRSTLLSIEFYDAKGILVMTIPTAKKYESISTAHLAPGLYIIKVSQESGLTYSKKWLKN